MLQVAVVDLNETCGEECKAQLDAEFGEGQSIFISCDVTNEDKLKGNARQGGAEALKALRFSAATRDAHMRCAVDIANGEDRKRGRKEAWTEEPLPVVSGKH